MMHRLLSLVLLATPIAAARGAEWTALFDGRSLAGWHAVGDPTFSLSDGILIGRQSADHLASGHLLSDATYGDCAIRVCFRAVRGNSGLCFRAAEDGAGGVSGCQAGIDPQRNTGAIHATDGRGWVAEPDPALLADALLRDDWNTLIVSCRGSRIRTALNGVHLAEWHDEQGRRDGHIALSVDGGQDVHIEFQSVDILLDAEREPLTRAADDRRLVEHRSLDGYFPFAPPTTLAAWQQRREAVRQRILVSAGLWPMPRAAPLAPQIHGRIERDDYTIDKVILESWPGFYVTGNLYRPRAAGPHAAVLSPHGHHQHGRFNEVSEGEARAQIARQAEQEQTAARYILQARCVQLARMGCVVFHYDMAGYADSRQIGHAEGFTDLDSLLRLHSFFGLQTFNSRCAFEFLRTLDDVDKARIGVTGASGGGTQTFILCAIDERPAAAFPAVMVSTAMQGGCVCENAPYLRIDTGNVEFAALTAPRPLAMSGAHDWTVDIESKGLPELQRLWRLLGAEDRVAARCWPQFEHNYNLPAREMMYAWFADHLGLVDTSRHERSFEPVAPAALSVFDADHPLPHNATDAAGIKRYWSEDADRQLAALTPHDAASLAEYRRVVGGALAVMLSTHLPAADAIDSTLLGEQRRDAAIRRHLNLARRDSGEVVQAALDIDPVTFAGTVVLDIGGQTDAATATALVRRGAARLAIAPLGSAIADAHLPVDGRHRSYAGYTFGYNRTLLAQRVHDVLTAITYARSLPACRKVVLLGTGDFAPLAILAGALAGEAVAGIAADLTFDYDRVDSIDHPAFLPGAIKYGGMPAFAALCAPTPLFASAGSFAALTRAAYAAIGANDRLADAGDATAEAMLSWLCSP